MSETAAGTEYLLEITYGGRDGVHGIEHRPLGVVPEKYVTDHARVMLHEHAVRVRVFSREVPAYEFVEELKANKEDK